MMNNSEIIKNEILHPLYLELRKGNIVEGLGHRTVEILNCQCLFDTTDSGIIDIDGIFKTSIRYVEAELAWYYSQNPHTDSIASQAKLWGRICDDNGMVNSNYGYLMFSPQNGYQYKHVVDKLNKNPLTKKAIMYYTNPMIHYTAGQDSICTVFVAYTNRRGVLNASVYMRSNDVRFGLIGSDLSWQIHMLRKTAEATGAEVGKITWHATTMHIYERHWAGLREIFE